VLLWNVYNTITENQLIILDCISRECTLHEGRDTGRCRNIRLAEYFLHLQGDHAVIFIYPVGSVVATDSVHAADMAPLFAIAVYTVTILVATHVMDPV
jgi:hypothetical protein